MVSHTYWRDEVKRYHKICSYHLVLNSWQKVSTIKLDIYKVFRLLKNAGTVVLNGFNMYDSFSASRDGVCHCLTTWTLCYQPETQHKCYSFYAGWCFPDCCFRVLLRGMGRVVMHTFLMSIHFHGISFSPLTSYHIAELKGFFSPFAVKRGR